MNDALLKAWIRQARAHLDAGTHGGGSECHRRYWLQQAGEKAIKALGLVLWNGPLDDEGRFRHHFLHKHSPLKQLARDIADDPTLPKSLRSLLRQIESELLSLDGQGMLRKLDATTPTTDPDDVSYRYPFRDGERDVAPQDWSTAAWDAYQGGNAMGIAAALKRFLDKVDNRRMQAR